MSQHLLHCAAVQNSTRRVLLVSNALQSATDHALVRVHQQDKLLLDGTFAVLSSHNAAAGSRGPSDSTQPRGQNGHAHVDVWRGWCRVRVRRALLHVCVATGQDMPPIRWRLRVHG